MLKQRKGSFHVRYVPHSNAVEVKPLGKSNPKRLSVLMSHSQYAEYIKWVDHDEQDIEESLPFLTKSECKLISDTLYDRRFKDEEEWADIEADGGIIDYD